MNEPPRAAAGSAGASPRAGSSARYPISTMTERIPMLGITTFGMFHTTISLVSLFSGLYLLLRHRGISTSRVTGRVYAWSTVATCVTGLFIFRHGGFNEAHALSILTLLVLGSAFWAERRFTPGSLRHASAILGYTLTVFFHFIPAYNETLVRLPVDAPYITGPDDPRLLPLVGGTAVVFCVAMGLQFLRVRRERSARVVARATG